MIARLLEELKKLIPKAGVGFDPSVFDDPVALKTAWTPLQSGGTNMRTHTLRIQPDGRASFRPAFGFIAFCGVFLFVGLGFGLGFPAAVLLMKEEPELVEVLIPLAFGLIFGGVGGGLLAFSARPVVFDKALKLAWRGWRDPGLDYDRGGRKGAVLCKLDDIHALQIVSEFIRGNKSSYTSYELNLVLADGSRIGVVDHGDPVQLRRDAAALGEYLEAAVWDSTS